jgi:serine protease Do
MRCFTFWLVTCTLCLSAIGRAAESDAKVPERSEAGMGQWLKRLGRVRLPGEHERGHAAVTGAFRDAATTPSHSTVRVLSEGLQSALGVVVRSDGLILTKASELEGKLECVLPDGTRLGAVRVAQRDDYDLALLRVSKANLPEVSWGTSTALPVGSWLITTNLDPVPVAIGVVSAPLHESPTPRAVLGVRMYRVDKGVRINLVMPGTGAAKAGIRAGDVVTTINGRAADTPETITEIISGLHPGDAIKLSVLREESPLSLTATLGDMSRLGGLEQAELMDSLGGPLSKRRAGFPSVIQHDSVVRPRECGGPVVDLDGKAVGINIARVSRVATYALPAEIAKRAVQEMLRDLPATTTVAHQSEVATSQERSASP